MSGEIKITLGELSEFYDLQMSNPAKAIIFILERAGLENVADMDAEEAHQAAEDLIDKMTSGRDIDDPLPASNARTRRGRGSRSR